MSLSNKALSAYRNGLRATRVAFRDDLQMLNAARKQMRDGMINPPNSELTKLEQIQHLNDVALFLRKNIVQGIKNDNSNKYHLQLHKESELGDNNSIKIVKKTMTTQGGGCCGGRNGSYK